MFKILNYLKSIKHFVLKLKDDAVPASSVGVFLDEVGLLPGRSPRPAPVLAQRRRPVDLGPPEQLRLATSHVPPRPGRQARGLQGAPEREGESGVKS